MKVINVQEAKNHLSRLVDAAAGGECIPLAKDSKPLAKRSQGRGLRELPLQYCHGEGLQTLSPHHAGPCDRMLVAQAVEENLTLITHDKKFEPYPVRILWT